jgi:hypothetical protein
MAKFTADYQRIIDGPAFGQPLLNRSKANRQLGRIRTFESLFVAPISGTAPAIADVLIWGKLPVRARILGHLAKLYWNAGTAACTINLGDSLLATRHVAATAITALGSVIVDNQALVNTAVGDVTINTLAITNVRAIGSAIVGALVTGTGIPAGTVVTAIDYTSRVLFISQAATATNAAVTLTVAGASFETSDDSSNAANGYGSTTDDCTLQSVVAGAQIANNQCIKLVMPFVMD